MTESPTAVTSTTADLSATDLLAAYRAGDLSPVEATRDALDRIDRLDGAVHAFVLVDPDGALTAAVASEQRWRRGEPAGVLDGVPSSIKDVLLTAGWPTRRGSHTIAAEGEWDTDGPAVARMREQGAVLLGKTTTPELAWKGVTDSPLLGATTNPWDPTRTAGGSSGGSAAAVGLGMGALSLGTDAGGSVRIPAAFTGTTTIKSSYGRVPHYPGSPFGTLAHVGPHTRTVADTALLLDVISGADHRDPWAANIAHPSCVEALAGGVASLRIAVSPALGLDVAVHPGVAAAFEAAVTVFAALGAHVEHADPGFADEVEAFHVLWFSGAAKAIEHLGPDARATMDPALVEIAEIGAGYSALDYLAAMAVRTELGVRMGAFHDHFDLLLTPTMPIPAFAGGVEVPPGWTGRPRWTSWTPFTYPFNMTQQPAASVPCGFADDDGTALPVGLQIVGPRQGDVRVLTAAHSYQQATDWHTRRPPLLG